MKLSDFIPALRYGATLDVDYEFATDEKLNFRSDGIYINSPATGKIQIVADGTGTDDIKLGSTVTFADDIKLEANKDLRGDAGTGEVDLSLMTGTFKTPTGITTIKGHLTMTDAKNIALDTTTGTKIGTATNQKLGFYNTTPVVQAGAYTQTYATADKTHAAMTSSDMPAGGTGASEGAWDTAAHRDTAIADFAELRADVIDLKQLVNSVIDDLQALGLVG